MFQLLKQDENKDEDALKIQLLKLHLHEFKILTTSWIF